MRPGVPLLGADGAWFEGVYTGVWVGVGAVGTGLAKGEGLGVVTMKGDAGGFVVVGPVTGAGVGDGTDGDGR